MKIIMHALHRCVITCSLLSSIAGQHLKTQNTQLKKTLAALVSFVNGTVPTINWTFVNRGYTSTSVNLIN